MLSQIQDISIVALDLIRSYWKLNKRKGGVSGLFPVVDLHRKTPVFSKYLTVLLKKSRMEMSDFSSEIMAGIQC